MMNLLGYSLRLPVCYLVVYGLEHRFNLGVVCQMLIGVALILLFDIGGRLIDNE